MTKITIIGSGFLGLTLALRLADQGNQVTIFESVANMSNEIRLKYVGHNLGQGKFSITLKIC